MKGLLVASGSIRDLDLLKSYYNKVDYCIAVDGGMNYCKNAGIVPDLVIGDLDSIDREVLSYIEDLNIEIFKYPVEKNATDLEIAADYLLEKNFNKIYLAGVVGSRWDHSLANILLLNKLKDRNADGIIVNNKNTMCLVDDYMEIRDSKNYISLVPSSDEGIEVSLEGFKYPLDRFSVDYGSTRCVSNELDGEVGIIRVHKGRAFVVTSED